MEKKEIGNSNVHYRFFPFAEFLSWQKKLNVKNVDLFGGTPHVWIDAYGATDGRELRREIESYGLRAASFTPEFSSMRYSLGSEGDAEKKTWDYLERCFLFADELGVEQVVISASGYLLDRDRQAQKKRMLTALERVCRMAEAHPWKLLLLNHYADATDMVRSLEDMKDCLEQLEGSGLAAAVDTASVYEAGESLNDWFACLGKRIDRVVLSNTKFDGSCHYWGDGYLNLQEILEALEKNHYRGQLGTYYMIRPYLSSPWTADIRSREMLDFAFDMLKAGEEAAE